MATSESPTVWALDYDDATGLLTGLTAPGAPVAVYVGTVALKAGEAVAGPDGAFALDLRPALGQALGDAGVLLLVGASGDRPRRVRLADLPPDLSEPPQALSLDGTHAGVLSLDGSILAVLLLLEPQ